MPDPIQSNTEAQNNTNPTTPEATQTNAIPESIQARFNELTGTIAEQRREMAAANQANQELIGRLAAMATTQHQPPPPPQMQIPEGVDPSLAQFLIEQNKLALAQSNAQMEQRMNQMFGQVRANQEMMEFQQQSVGADQRVASLAQSLLADWKAKGKTGWNVQDAFMYAEAIVVRQDKAKLASTKPNGSGHDAITTGNASGPNPATNRQLPPAKSDAELKAMTMDQRVAYWDSRVGDSEILPQS